MDYPSVNFSDLGENGGKDYEIEYEILTFVEFWLFIFALQVFYKSILKVTWIQRVDFETCHVKATVWVFNAIIGSAMFGATFNLVTLVGLP